MRGIIISLTLFAVSFTNANEPTDEELFAVTPENCGVMSLEECEVTMSKALEWLRNEQAEREAIKENIRKMHEEALKLLSESVNNTNDG